MKTKPPVVIGQNRQSVPSLRHCSSSLMKAKTRLSALAAGLQPLESRRSVPRWVKHHHAGWGCQLEG